MARLGPDRSGSPRLGKVGSMARCGRGLSRSDDVSRGKVGLVLWHGAACSAEASFGVLRFGRYFGAAWLGLFRPGQVWLGEHFGKARRGKLCCRGARSGEVGTWVEVRSRCAGWGAVWQGGHFGLAWLGSFRSGAVRLALW